MSTGNITQIIGAVIDVEFPKENLPKVFDALKVDETGLILEVQQQLGDGVVRTIAMGASEGLKRGISVSNTQGPISVPVGEETLGRIMNVLGEPIDDWMEKDFLDIQSICEWNQETKLMANVLDAKPFENLCWLINELHSCQSELKPGMIIITGSVFKVRQAKIGDKINHILSDHGKVSIEVV